MSKVGHTNSKLYLLLCSSKRGETDGHTQGYKNPPVPRRLVDESYIPPGLSPAYARSSEDMPRTRLVGKFRKIRTGTQADLQLCRLPIRPQGRSGPTHTRPLAEPSGQNTGNALSGCTQSAMGGSGRIRLPTSGHIGQSGGEAAGLPMQESNTNCTRVAQHFLVLGFGGHVQSNSIEPASFAQSVDTTLQSDPSQKSDKSKSPCMAPRASAIKEQGFSEAVAARIEAPQRGSTRSVFANQVDLRAPPIKSVADFLMYLFQDRKLQPSTIDGYRSAIADKLGNSPINISKHENLTRLLDSFHRDIPKGRRGISSWNLSLVLHQLTEAPFEPLKRRL